MATIPCSNTAELCSDAPISNLSSADPDGLIHLGRIFPPINPLLGRDWRVSGCIAECVSTISALDAFICAYNQWVLCTGGGFVNVEACCASECPDGTIFTFCIEAGAVFGQTQEEADQFANTLACEQARTNLICLSEIPTCTCIGVPYSETILAQGGSGDITWQVVDGSLPDGLQLTGSLIAGTPTANGTYEFTIRATTTLGNFMQKQYRMVVLEITTTALDEYTLGEAYSFQLTAAGGSGSYAWRVSSGTLPTGLSLSSGGLISGTPTAAGSGDVVFEVIDTVCDAVNESFFTPVVLLSTDSETVIRTRRGYPEFIASTGALYKKVTYTGEASQVATVYASFDDPFFGDFTGGAKYIYSGSSEIDVNGNFISSHRKDLFVACHNSVEPNIRDIFGLPNVVTKLLGYCWAPDIVTCSNCSEDENDWAFKRNDATHQAIDYPHYIFNNRLFIASSPTVSQNIIPSGGTSAPMYLGTDAAGTPTGQISNYPFATLNTVTSNYVNLTSSIDVTATLSEPFTEAEQIAGQLKFASNGSTAETTPDSKTWTNDSITNIRSRFTSVDFTLDCSELVEGETYTVRYELWKASGGRTVVTQQFVALGETHQITGTIPTPDSGDALTIKNATIDYS